MARGSVTLPACFAAFPGVVLHLSADGTVLESNGCLERELGITVTGRPFADVLDARACGDKWDRILAEARDIGAAARCELVLTRDGAVLEPRAFSILWDGEAAIGWLIEHPSDPRLHTVRHGVTGVSSELATAQRDLVHERSRLARALTDSDQLAEQVRVQNEELAAQNEELIVMTEELDAQRRELERSNHALDEFAHAISHDLKAPLRSVANYARWIEEDLGDVLTGEPRGHMDLLRSQVERMRSMIAGLLDYSRVGRVRKPPETIDVASVVREVIALLDPPATARIVLAPDLPRFAAERAPLRQVFLNLVGNALRHARRPDVRVEVGVTDRGDAYEFHVRDNGPGIPPRARDKVWRLFHTIPPDGTEGDFGADGEGTGVGLTIVRQLVELQGGRAWVDSEEGKGATFHFLWPKYPDAPPAGEADSASGT